MLDTGNLFIPPLIPAQKWNHSVIDPGIGIEHYWLRAVL